MPGLRSYPPEDEVNNREESVRKAVEELATQQLSEASKGNVHVRQLLPDEDLESGTDNGWNGTDREWTQDGLDEESLNEVYEIDSDNNADRKVIGIYALSHVSNAAETTQVEFRDGTGTRFERVNIEETLNRDDDEVAMLEQPIIFNATQDGTIHQWLSEVEGEDTTGDDQIVYHGVVGEKMGRTLGERAGRE